MIKFLTKIGFTRTDLLISGFLLSTLAFGLILKYSGWHNVKQFDYSKSDSTFEQQIKSAFSEKQNTALNSEQEHKLNTLRSFSDSLLEQKEQSSVNNKLAKLDKKININLAYASDLQMLPGIGEVTAERIIEYREQNNGFKKITEIMNVKGIGQKKFDKIKDYITID